MGNTNSACVLSNYSRRNIRVFSADSALGMDAFITSRPEDEASSRGKTFCFRKDCGGVRVLASQTQEVPWDARHFLSVFVEDEDDETICAKQILYNITPSAPVTVLLYDV